MHIDQRPCDHYMNMDGENLEWAQILWWPRPFADAASTLMNVEWYISVFDQRRSVHWDVCVEGGMLVSAVRPNTIIQFEERESKMKSIKPYASWI